jgi:hypothetical protein
MNPARCIRVRGSLATIPSYLRCLPWGVVPVSVAIRAYGLGPMYGRDPASLQA